MHYDKPAAWKWQKREQYGNKGQGTPAIDAGHGMIAVTKTATRIRISPPRDSEYQVDNGSWAAVPDDGMITLPLEHAIELQVRNPHCQADGKTIVPGKDDLVELMLLSAQLKPKCPIKNVEVQINGKGARLDEAFTVPFGKSSFLTRAVKVEFLGDHVDHAPIVVTVTAGTPQDVVCVTR